jgi:hypothetical protein
MPQEFTNPPKSDKPDPLAYSPRDIRGLPARISKKIHMRHSVPGSSSALAQVTLMRMQEARDKTYRTVSLVVQALSADKGHESAIGPAREMPDAAHAADAARAMLAQISSDAWREVRIEDLKAVMQLVLDVIEQAPPGLLEQAAAKVAHDQPSMRTLQRLLGHCDELTELAWQATEQLEPHDRPRRSVLFSLVLVGACLLSGGAAIPLLLGAKAELIYANTVGAATAVCAGAALIQPDRKR